MARKALLIGAQTLGLGGVEHDIRSLTTALEPWSFDVLRREAESASRAGILDACEELIRTVVDGDSVLLYFSGLGGTFQPPTGAGASPSPPVRYIVPTDFDESGPFRGITSIELSTILRRMSEQAGDVALILDCSFDARPPRASGMSVKALGQPVPPDLMTAHLDALRRRGVISAEDAPVIRVDACAPGQFAYEFDGPAGKRLGRFTDGLVHALREANGVPANWSTVIGRVRRHLATLMPGQRPVATGPLRRGLFERREVDPLAPLSATLRQHRVELPGGPLLGVQIGDEFAIGPDNGSGPHDAGRIGDVIIDSLDVTWAAGPLRRGSAYDPALKSAPVCRTRAAWSPMPVGLPADDPRTAALFDAIAVSRHLRPAEPGEIYAVHVDVNPDGRLVVSDQIGALHAPRAAGGAGLRRVVRDLTRMAHAAALRGLTDDPHSTLDGPVGVEIGLLGDGGNRMPLPETGTVAFLGQRMYARVHNQGEHAVYAWVYDIGVAGRVRRLAGAPATGVPVGPGAEWVLGDSAGHGAEIRFAWPTGEGPDIDHARPTTVLLVVSSAPQDLDVFGRGDAPPGVRSPLERRFDQIVSGTARHVGCEAVPSVRYLVRAVDFDLVPTPPPRVDQTSFQVDERPDIPTRLLSATRPAPVEVDVRVSGLVAHHNRSFRCATLRLDAVVVTMDPEGRPLWRVHTERFADVKDGVQLPRAPALLYRGPAGDQLDLAVWVSCDDGGAPDLADLLASTAPHVSDRKPGGRRPCGPVQTTYAAIDIGASVVTACDGALRGASGTVAGLYRTTLPALGGSDAHRPVRQNMVRARDFSFTYTIEMVAQGVGSTGRSQT
jgi:hypothetical protein